VSRAVPRVGLVVRSKTSRKPYGGAVEIGSALELKRAFLPKDPRKCCVYTVLGKGSGLAPKVDQVFVKCIRSLSRRFEFCQINSLKFRIPKSSSFGCIASFDCWCSSWSPSRFRLPLEYQLESKSVSFVFGLPVGVRFGFKSSPESLQSLLSRCLCPF
jgi:hypothetical protein